MRITNAVFVYKLRNNDDLLWHTRKHCHKKGEFEITYFISGTGTFTNYKSVYRIQDGSLFFNTEDHKHFITVESNPKNMSYYAILVKTEKNENEILSLAHLLEKKGMLRLDKNRRFFFEEIRAKSNSQCTFSQISANYQILSFLYGLMNHTFKPVSTKTNVHIETALKYMQSNVTNKISLSDIAQQINLSEEHFIRIFEESLHISPMKYYSRLKIEASIGMLGNPNYTISEISKKLNYSSQFHYSKQFKQFMQISPSEFRNSNIEIEYLRYHDN